MVLDNLKKVFKGELIQQKETLDLYSKDSSIFKIDPELVAISKDVEDIKHLVNFVNQNSKDGVSITVRSAGTDMTGGAINESIILDIGKNLNQLIDIENSIATVQPGMLYRDFEVETLKQNLLLPTYPASREICTVGGMVASNAGGELELAYGPVDRYISEIKIVLADGNEYTFVPLDKKGLEQKMAQKDFEGKLYSSIFELIKENSQLIANAKPKVSKNSTGYHIWDVFDGEMFDLSKLIVGSQGTLGVITEIKFKLIKPKQHQVLLVISLEDLNVLDKVVSKTLDYKPEAFEVYDDETLQLAASHAWDLSKSFKHSNRLSAYFDFLTEKIQSMQGKLPKLTLLANFTSDDLEEAKQRANMAKNGLKELNLKVEIKDTLKSAEKYWIVRHKSFGLLMKYSQNGKASSFIDDVIVKPEFLPEFLPKLNEIIKPYKNKMVYTFAGHIGDGNFHIIPLMDLSNPDIRAIIPELMDKVFDLVFSYQGSMSAEHNDGLIRGPYLPKMYGTEIYQLFKEVKNIFDPNNIFNPHKKADATFKYSFDHIIKE